MNCPPSSASDLTLHSKIRRVFTTSRHIMNINEMLISRLIPRMGRAKR